MPNTASLTICDVTLRDGSHAYNHKITADQIYAYAKASEESGFDYLEVGHGNGLGASSLQVGESLLSDYEMLRYAKNVLKNTKLSVHVIPGFATLQKDIEPAIKLGVDLFRIGCHCTEADISQKHISFIRSAGKEAWGVLMMSHMASAEVLLEESKKMQSYGAQGVVLMDSAGAYTPSETSKKISLLVENLEIPVGFHAHNNLGLSIANSLSAIETGARILDGTAKGFGAGAGNAPIEIIAALVKKLNYPTNINLYKALDAAELAANLFSGSLPKSDSITIVSGISGVFSGFSKPVIRIAEKYKLDPRDILTELGLRNAVGGQEDLIVEVASILALKSK